MVTVLSLSCGAAALQGNEAAAPDAFGDLDAFFVAQFSQQSSALGQSTRPILVTDGFNYVLRLRDGTSRSFQGAASPFHQLKTVAHVLPALYSIGSSSWDDRKDPHAWKWRFTEYQAKVRAALDEVERTDWSSPAWPGRQAEVREFMRDSLRMADRFLTRRLKEGSYARRDYQEFAEHYLHTILAAMYLADAANTSATLAQLRQWKTDLGPQWDGLYVLITGSKGSPVQELTPATSTTAQTVASLMNPQDAKSHILIMPAATSLAEVERSFGGVLNGRVLAATTFLSEEDRQAGGFYQALQDGSTPLARQDVLHIVQQETLQGKPRLPYIGILPKDRAFLEGE